METRVQIPASPIFKKVLKKLGATYYIIGRQQGVEKWKTTRENGILQ